MVLIILGLLILTGMSVGFIALASSPLWYDGYVGIPDWAAWTMTGLAALFVVFIWCFIIDEIRQ